jgi:hypothetical protein
MHLAHHSLAALIADHAAHHAAACARTERLADARRQAEAARPKAARMGGFARITASSAYAAAAAAAAAAARAPSDHAAARVAHNAAARASHDAATETLRAAARAEADAAQALGELEAMLPPEDMRAG